MAQAGPFDLGLGEVQPTREGMNYLRPAQTDLSGFQQAFNDLGDIGAILYKRQKDVEDYKLNSATWDFKRQAWDNQEQGKQTATPGDQEIYKNLDERYTKLENDFLAKVPADQQDKVKASLESYRTQLHMDGLDFQYKSTDQFVKSDITKKGDQLGNDIAADPSPDSLIKRRDEFFKNVIDPAPISELEKLAYKDHYTSELAKISAEELSYRQKLQFGDPKVREDFFMARANPNSDHPIDPAHIGEMQPHFASGAMGAIKEAEDAVGQQAVINSTYRTYGEQADSYAKGHGQYPVAHPGHSAHERGAAVDIQRGPVLDWLHAHAKHIEETYGVGFPVSNDPVHMAWMGKVTNAQTGPTSLDTLVRAVIGQESTGDPNAVSPKGAAGLMQVMPDTARGLARALQDPNFPAGGTDEQIREYLKNPGVNIQYGTEYLKEQLKEFGGDVRLALIAYNAGPQVARDLVSGKRTDIPAETQDYLHKILGNLGQEEPTFNLKGNPAYSTIPYETWNQIDNNSSQRANEYLRNQAAADSQQQNAEYNALSLAIQRGDPNGGRMIEDWVDSHHGNVDAGKYHTLIEYQKAADAEREQATLFEQQVQGQRVADPTNSDDNKAQNAGFKKDSGRAKLQAGDENYINQRFFPNAQTTGMIAPDAVDQLNGMLRSGNQEMMLRAAGIVDRLEQASPSAFNQFGDDAKRMVRTFRERSTVDDKGQLISDMMGGRTPQERKYMIDMGKTFDSEVTDQNTNVYVSPKEIFDGLVSRVTSEGIMGKVTRNVSMGTLGPDYPVPGFEGVANQKLYDEYISSYRHYYQMMGGDPEKAKSAAFKELSDNWGLTDTGGRTVLMKHPPEKSGFQPIQGSMDWIGNNARFEFKVLPTETIQLISDEKTDTQYRNRLLDPNGDHPMPQYRLIKINSDGVPVALNNGNYWTPTMTDRQKEIKGVSEELALRLKHHQALIYDQSRESQYGGRGPVPKDRIEMDKRDLAVSQGKIDSLRQHLDALQSLERVRQPETRVSPLPEQGEPATTNLPEMQNPFVPMQ